MARQIFSSLWFLTLVVITCASGCGGKRVSGGGSTFIDPIMQKWSSEWTNLTGSEIDYRKSGSGNGIQQMSARTIDFGCSDAPMNEEQLLNSRTEFGEVLHIPLTAGAVAIIYNLPHVPAQKMVLSGPVLAGIYRNQIRRWNHPAIASLNPDVPLPDQAIIPVYRSEGSGTSKLVTEFLAKVDKDFAAEIGSSTEPRWPKIGTGQNGNDGVAGFVKNNPYSIGYVELFYAHKNGIPFARVRNCRGFDIAPDEPGAVQAAIRSAITSTQDQPPYSLHELTFSLTNSGDENAYPICGMCYAVLYVKQPAQRGRKLVDFLKWALTDGQQFTSGLDYAPLPEELTRKVISHLEKVQYE